MKKSKSILFVSLFFLSFYSYAQYSKNHALYLGVEGKLEEQRGKSPSLNYIYKNKYSFQLRKSRFPVEPALIPSDFQQVRGGFSNPEISLQTHEFLIGKIINIKNTEGRIRLNLKAGFSLNQFSTPTNFVKKDCSGLFGCWGANYSYERKKTENIGFLVNPSLEIPFLQWLGVSFSPHVNINKYKLVYGWQIGIILGVLRPRLIKKVEL